MNAALFFSENKGFWRNPLFPTIFLILLSVSFWQVLVHREEQKLQQLTDINLKNAKLEIAARLEQYNLALQRSATRLEYLGTKDSKFLDLDANSYEFGLIGLKQMGLADPLYKVTWSYPRGLGEGLFKFEKSDEEKRNEVFEAAIAQKQIVWSGNMNLKDGPGFIFAVPLIAKGRHIGFLFGTIDSHLLFNQIAAFRGFDVVIRDGATELFCTDAVPTKASSEWVRKDKLKMGLAQLEIEMIPTADNSISNKSRLPDFVLLISLIFSLSVGILLRAQRTLGISMQRFEFVTDGTNEGVFEQNLKTKKLYISPNGKNLLGLPLERESVLEDLTKRMHPEDRVKMLAARTAYLERRAPAYDIEYRYFDENGENPRWINARGKAAWNEKGEATKLVGFFRDITERKKSEEEILELNTLNEAILENSPSAITIFAEDGTCLKTNPAAVQISGSTLEKILDGNFMRIPGWRQSGLLDAAAEALVTNRSVSFEGELTTLSGKKVSMMALFVPVKLAGKKVLIFHAADVSELKRASEVAQLYRSALDQTAAVYFADKNGVITHINENVCIMSGYRSYEVLGKHFSMFKSDRHPEETFINLWQNISSGKTWNGEICNKKKSGETIWADVTIVPQVNRSGAIERYIAVHIDITQRKNAELQLLNSAKMSSLGEMAAGIAHEINNPLAIIQGSCHRLQKLVELEVKDVPKIQKYANTILTTTDRIAKIITGLRTFARDGSHDSYRSIKVHELISSAMDICTARFANAEIPIRIGDVDPDLTIECQEVQLSQVLVNLMNNSFDAVAGTKGPFVEIKATLAAEGLLEISVVDSGPGIPEEIASKIMQPFFTTKEVGAGTGLGLSVSSGIVKSHKGELFLDRAAANTRFVIRLPIFQTKQKTSA